jgi:phosphatidylserine/phosphatidylglycerophosphate/cardiolipin synthase-like enzyme
MIGSPNQNYRSMVLDGEASLLVSGTSINAGLIDLVALTGQCHWIDQLDELAPFFPESGSVILRLARWLKILL